MEGLDCSRIAVCSAMRTGIAIQAPFLAAVASPHAARESETPPIVEASFGIGLYRAGFETGLFGARVAEMNRFPDPVERQFDIEQQRAAIGVPEPIFRMHEDAERRRAQSFRAHRPLLERLKRPVRWRNGTRSASCRNRADDLPAPCIERIGRHGRLCVAPSLEMRPIACAGIADEDDRSCRPVRKRRRRLLRGGEIEAASNKKPMGFESSGNRVYDISMHRRFQSRQPSIFSAAIRANITPRPADETRCARLPCE